MSPRISSAIMNVALVIILISLMSLTISLLVIGASTIAPEYRAAAISFAGITSGLTFAFVADWISTHV